jgi:ATP-dependent DNA helicase RecG
LGEFLKELDLTEGRATGIPTIQKALAENGSKPASIETDDDRSFFLIDIPCHPNFVGNVQVNVQVELAEIERVIEKMSKLCPSYDLVISQSILEKLAICLLRCKNEISGHDMLKDIDATSYKQRKRKYLDKLMEMKLIRMTKPDKPTARNQRYICTDLGKQIIEQ